MVTRRSACDTVCSSCRDAFPPDEDLSKVLEAVCALNGFEPANVLKNCRGGARLNAARWPCCVVEELPAQPRHRDAPRNPFTFGQEADGYVLVRAERPRTGWPLSKRGQPLPIRLHRWVSKTRPDLFATHACDDPRCIAASHICPATVAENNKDTAKRKRRRIRQPARQKAAAQQQAERRAPAPTLTPGTPRVASRERVFCLAGYSSPTRLARRLTLSPQGAAALDAAAADS